MSRKDDVLQGARVDTYAWIMNRCVRIFSTYDYHGTSNADWYWPPSPQTPEEKKTPMTPKAGRGGEK